jgi:hypothetical protein
VGHALPAAAQVDQQRAQEYFKEKGARRGDHEVARQQP